MNKAINSLDELMNGAVTERFQDAMQNIMQNIFDPNTDATKTRSLTLNLKIKPNKSRDAATMSMDVKVSLSPPAPMENMIFLGCDDDGVVTAWERGSQVPGQVDMQGEAFVPKVVTFEHEKGVKARG